jgi:hypothetical protein
MTERHIRPTGRRSRIFLTAATGLLWLSLSVNVVLLIIDVVSLEEAAWSLFWHSLAGLGLLVAVIQNLRGGVVVREEGITVDNGLGRGREIAWEQIAATRPPRPPFQRAVIELRDGPDVSFGGWSPLAPPGMTPGQFRELDELISEHRIASESR